MSSTAPDPKEARQGSNKGAGGAEPSGPQGDNPSTAGPGPTGVRSSTPENKQGHLNPSAPEDSNTTPQTTTVK